MPSKTLTIRVPAKLRTRLDRLAKRSKKSQSILAINAVEQFVTEQERQQSILDKADMELSSGKSISHHDTRRWLLSWGSDKELPPPSCG
jgi:predicted transcriptional regulator